MQWKRSWVPFPLRTNKTTGLFLTCFILLMTACSSGSVQPTPAPTLILIPSTPTFTPVPPTETPTRIPAIRPESLSTPVPRYLSSLSDAEQRRLANLAALDLLERTQADPLILQLLVFDPWNADEWVCLEGLDLSDGYRVVYQLRNEIFDYNVSVSDTVVLCQQANIRQVDADVRLLIDPVAAALVILAKARVSRERDVSEGNIRVDEIVPRTWPDTSLGCPEAGITYAEQNIDGYFIRLLVNDRWYQLHTDFERVTLCASGDTNAVLPESAIENETTPESTPDIDPEAAQEINIDA